MKPDARRTGMKGGETDKQQPVGVRDTCPGADREVRPKARSEKSRWSLPSVRVKWEVFRETDECSQVSKGRRNKGHPEREGTRRGLQSRSSSFQVGRAWLIQEPAPPPPILSQWWCSTKESDAGKRCHRLHFRKPWKQAKGNWRAMMRLLQWWVYEKWRGLSQGSDSASMRREGLGHWGNNPYYVLFLEDILVWHIISMLCTFPSPSLALSVRTATLNCPLQTDAVNLPTSLALICRGGKEEKWDTIPLFWRPKYISLPASGSSSS